MSRHEPSGTGFEWTGDAHHDETSPPDEPGQPTHHEYPPDAVLGLPSPLTFSKLVVLIAVGFGLIDFLLVGFPETPIPYNYPFFVGFIYIVGVVWVLRRMHAIFDGVKLELIDISRRTTADDILFDRETAIRPEEIAAEVDRTLSRAFHPTVIVGGAVFGGLFTVGVMWFLGVLSAYPYVLMDFAYGAGHGLYYGPIVAAVYLVYRVSTEYITDIDLLDPDGVGGYKWIGDAIISLITYGIGLVTLDFIILSSASFLDRPVFLGAVFLLYGAMLVGLFGIAVAGTLAIRRRLLGIREEKTAIFRELFNDAEARFWEKQQRGESPQPEADQIQAMQTMFDQLHGMDLWPINLASFARLAASGGSSAAIALYKAGYIPTPF